MDPSITANKELLLIKQLVENPPFFKNNTLCNIYYNFYLALQHSLIIIEDNLLIYCEPISCTELYARLLILQKEFYNIFFIGFHTNPAGGHLNAYRTLHRLGLHNYWPGMKPYTKKMCTPCPSCALANITKGKSYELVYFSYQGSILGNTYCRVYSWCTLGLQLLYNLPCGCCRMCSF
jgi:hypothetical protein